MNIGKCLLCHKKKELCKQSHIIPDFLNLSLTKTEKSQIFEIKSIEVKHPNQKRSHFKKPIQTGSFSSDILCENCDNSIIGGLERYAYENFYQNSKLKNFSSPDFSLIWGDQKIAIAENIDYNKFKRFLLTILFRASISNHDAFNAVNLRSSDKEKIRKVIFDNNLKHIDEYGILVSTGINPESRNLDAISVRGKNPYSFYIKDMIYSFYKKNDLFHKAYNNVSLFKTNRVKILLISKDEWDDIKKRHVTAYREMTLRNMTENEKQKLE